MLIRERIITLVSKIQKLFTENGLSNGMSYLQNQIQ